MQGLQPSNRQADQTAILQQPGNIVIKMNEVQPITTVGELFQFRHVYIASISLLFVL